MNSHNIDRQKVDRRVQRTEQLLYQALINLILEKGYDDITVQDILDRANIGRSTFYAHYRDKEDLLLSGFQALFEAFQNEVTQTAAPGRDPVQTGKDLSLFFFRHAGSHRHLFKAMIGQQGGKIIQDHIQKYFTGFLREHIITRLTGQDKELKADLLAHFIASSYLSLVTWWLDHNLPFSAEEMDGLYQMLVIPGVRALLAKEH